VSHKAQKINRVQHLRSQHLVVYMQKLHIIDSLEKRNEFLRNPYYYFKASRDWVRPRILSHQQRIENHAVSHSGYDCVELLKGNLVKG